MTKEQISIPSPNVASLGLFNQLPVSTFTGLPEINIPIYTFKEGDISIPINLSYHAAGFRPDDHPSWTGAGWSLNASSWTITRKVNGRADDYDTYENEQNSGRLNPMDSYSSRSGYYYNRTLLDQSQWNQLAYLQNLTWSSTNNLNIIGSRKDSEPDEFSFSFPNGNGKFYLDMDGTWKVDCDRAVKITFNGSFIPVPFTVIAGSLLQGFGYHTTFSGFTVTDIDGIQYVYGGSADFIEYSVDFMNQDVDFWQADSWFLKEIIEPSGKKISFQYERGGYINQLMMSLSQNFGTGGSASGFWQPPCGLSQGSFREDYTGRLIYPLYIKKIIGSLGSVTFNKTLSQELKIARDFNSAPNTISRDIYQVMWSYFILENTRSYDRPLPILREYYLSLPINHSGPVNYRNLDYFYFYTSLLQWYQLANIEVANTSRIIRKFDFTYSQSADERLTLRTMRDGIGSSSEGKPTYEFFYNAVDRVPYFSGKIDHWGFYNGTLANISALETDASVYYNSRSANGIYAAQGVLNKIKYPTGGYTEFEYQGNYASKTIPMDRSQLPVDYNNAVGGLRISKIRNVDLSSPAKNETKEYFYVKGYKNSSNVASLVSSGVLGGLSQYLYKNFKVPAGTDGAYFLKNQFNSLSQLPASNNSQGSHIGYSEVVEKNADGSYTIFYYQNFDNGYRDESSPTINLAFTPYGPYTSLARERGKLYKLEQYSNNDILVYRKNISYNAIDKSTQYAKAIRAKSYTLCPTTNDRYAEAIAYKNYTYAYLPTSETVTTFDVTGLNPITTTKNFTYNSYRLLKTESIINSDLVTHSLKNYYPVDYAGLSPYNDMVQSNIISPLVMQEFSVDAVVQETFRKDYAKGLSINANLVLPSSISIKRSTATETRIQFNKYNERGQLLSFSKDGNLPICYLWGYGKNYPIAEIKHADYSIVEAVLGVNNIDTYGNTLDVYNAVPKTSTVLKNFIAPLRTDIRLKDAQVTSYLYDPLVGMTSITDLNNITTTYDYDSYTRLLLEKDNQSNITKYYQYHYKK